MTGPKAQLEVGRWMAGEYAPQSDEQWNVQADRIARRWAQYWPIIQTLTNQAASEEPLTSLSFVLATAATRHPPVEVGLADAFSSAGPQLRYLIAESILGDLVRDEAVVGAHRVDELLGRSEVVTAYCRHSHDDPDADTAWDRWAWNVVQGLAADAQASWSMILDLVEAADDEALGLVAAGPLEDWLGAYGPQQIERVEEQAQRSERFRKALGGVWVWSSLPPDTFDRVAAAAGSALDAPATAEDAAERRALDARFNELSAIMDDESVDEQARTDAFNELFEL